MKLYYNIIVLILLISSISLVYAEFQQTQQSSKIFLSPFYRQSMTANTNNTYTVTINPPDKLNYVSSAIISIQAYLNPTVTFTLWVNGQSCNNPTFLVSTTFAGAGQGMITFDCSNRITTAGTYTVTVQSSSANVGASTAWLDLTYTNKPKATVEIHGTEYTPNTPAKVWLQLINSNGTALTSGVCYADIYTPDNTQFLERATMTNMLHDGIYYYDLIAPTEHGVYPAIATCYYDAGQTYNFAQEYTIVNGTYQSGTISDTWTLDGNYLNLVETPSPTSPRRAAFDFNFTNGRICGNISELLLNGITISWSGRWNSNLANDVITTQIFNYTSNNWMSLDNTVTGSGTGTKSVSNGIGLVNLTKAGFVNSSGTNLRVRFIDTTLADTSSTGFDTDYLSVSCDQLSNPQWQEVKGSSEIHISSDLDYILNPTATYTINNTQSTTLVNGTVFNNTYYTGIFRNDFIIESASAVNETTLIEYQGLHSIPCNSVITFFMHNNTGYYQQNYTTQRQTTEDHCSINFNVNLVPDQIKEYRVEARNTWESDIRSSYTGALSLYPLLSAGCDLWAISQNETPYPYLIPKNQTNEINHSAFYRSCGNYYDDFYWLNKTFTQSQIDKANIMDEQSYLQYESDYYSLKFAEDKLNTITSLLIQDLEASGIYSQQLILNVLNRNDTYGNRFFANISTPQLNYYQLSNLNFTNISVTATVNNSAISEGVWNYTNRTLSVDGISQITTSIWGYTGIINTNILNSIASSVWNFVSRYVHGEII